MKGSARAARAATAQDELLVLAAGDRTALRRLAGEAAERFEGSNGSPLRSLLAEIGEARPSHPLVLAVVSASAASFADKLRHAAGRLADPDCRRINDRGGIFFSAEPMATEGGRVALMFPGEGSQYPGMLADLCIRFDEARRPFDRIDSAFAQRDRDLLPSQIVFGGDHERIWDMDGAVEVVFSANAALLAVLESLKLEPDVVVGHSTGDYSALFASGAIAIKDDAELAAMMLGLNDLYQNLAAADVVDEVRLLAVGAGAPGEVDAIVRDIPALELAMDNCPHQRVFAGPPDAVASARTRLASQGAVLEELAFKRGYHTPAFWPALEQLRPFFEGLPLQAPDIETWSCATAAEVPDDVDELRDLVLRQWAMPVRFRETVERLWESGVRIFVDAGPRGNLSAFVKDILRGRPHLAVACDGHHKPTVTHLLFALGQLAANGVELDLGRLYVPAISGPPTRSEAIGEGPPSRRGPVLTLATGWPELRLPDSIPARHTVRGGNRAGEGSPVATFPQAGSPPQPSGPQGGRGPANERDAIVAEHFENARRMVKAQERVLTRFLEGLGTPRVDPACMPLLGSAYEVRGGVLDAAVELSVERCPFLVDHTLGGRVSEADPGLLALPVMPLTMTLELAAEAALAVHPGWVCIGFEQVVASRWITMSADGRTDVRVTARSCERSAEHAAVAVEVTGSAGESHLGVRVLLAPSYPPAPAAPRGSAETAPLWDRARVYREAMFHGPSFRGIEQVGRVDENGAEARLEVLPGEGLLDTGNPAFATDPVLLDQPGQLVGVWTASRLSEGCVIFPTGLERLELFSPPLPPGRRVGCRAAIRLVGDNGVASDLEVDDGEGLVHARFTGWKDKRFRAPAEFLEFMLDPKNAPLAGPLVEAAPPRDGGDAAAARVARDDLPPGFSARNGLWQQVVVGLTMSREERRAWREQKAAADHGERWLLTRLAAKEAGRRWLARRGLAVPPADVVTTDDGGVVAGATGRWVEMVGGTLEIEVRYCDREPAAEAECRLLAAGGADRGITEEHRRAARAVGAKG